MGEPQRKLGEGELRGRRATETWQAGGPTAVERFGSERAPKDGLLGPGRTSEPPTMCGPGVRLAHRQSGSVTDPSDGSMWGGEGHGGDELVELLHTRRRGLGPRFHVEHAAAVRGRERRTATPSSDGVAD